MWMSLGHLNAARWARQWTISSFSVAWPWSTTAAVGSSPWVGCGTAKATASETAGCESRTSSISSGEIFSPLRLMNSLMRPTRYRHPLSSR